MRNSDAVFLMKLRAMTPEERERVLKAGELLLGPYTVWIFISELVKAICVAPGDAWFEAQCFVEESRREIKGIRTMNEIDRLARDMRERANGEKNGQV